MNHLLEKHMEIWGGIECTINRVENEYFDQIDFQGHFERKDDLKHICDLGITKLRYPIIWEKHQPHENEEINWRPVDENLRYLKSRNVDVIAGLVHHGSGPSFVSLMDSSFEKGLAAYAEKVAKAFPWINFYTPVNEPLTTARFCGLYGLWYPHQKDDFSFLRILINECRATILAMEAVRKINPKAQLVFTEDLGSTHSTKSMKYQADFENHRRWLSIDLICGKVDIEHPLWKYLTDSGISASELDFFNLYRLSPDILGFNYYITSERYLDKRTWKYPQNTHGKNKFDAYADVEAIRVNAARIHGLEILLKLAWNRYSLPMAITESHLNAGREDQMKWLQSCWDTANRLKKQNVDLRAVTSWALLGSFGWEKLLTSPPGSYESGAFELRSGEIRATALVPLISGLATGRAYRHPALNGCGWWERDSRIIYGRSERPSEAVSVETRPILMIGTANGIVEQFEAAGSWRGVTCKGFITENLDLNDLKKVKKVISRLDPWAIIYAVKHDLSCSDCDECDDRAKTNTLDLAIACHNSRIKYCALFAADSLYDERLEYDSKLDEQLLMLNPDILIIRQAEILNGNDDAQLPAINYPALMNKCLDFLIDDEKGVWYASGNDVFSRAEMVKKEYWTQIEGVIK
jgi:dTDP-4-dehydrorhamnose reductase